MPEASVRFPITGFCYFLTSLLAVLTPYSPALAQHVLRVDSVEFRGNRHVADSVLLQWLGARSGDVFSRAELDSGAARLLRSYAREGYLNASIESISLVEEPTHGTGRLIIALSEGPPAVVRSFAINGLVALDESTLRLRLLTRIGERFRQPALENDVHRILRLYENAGYPFARVSISDVAYVEAEGSAFVDLAVTVREGERVRISGITVEGNHTTKQSVIVREARLRELEPYSPELVEKVVRRLNRTRLFSAISPPTVTIGTDATATIHLNVTEGNHNRFDGVVGYVPAVGVDRSGYLTGLVHLQFRNLLGTARRLQTRWQREDRATQEIELRYVEPWIAAVPLNAEFGLLQRKQDSTYVRRVGDLLAELMMSEEFRVTAAVSRIEVIPSDRPITPRVAQSTSTTFGAGFSYDNRDDPMVPTAGALYRAEVGLGTKRRSIGTWKESESIRRTALDVEYYFSPFQRQVVAAALHVRDIRTGTMELSDLFRFGGATTVRGYREGQFLASRALWLNAEYRLHVAPVSAFYGFFDLAHFSVPESPTAGLIRSEKTKAGFGVGVRFDSALGIIAVSIAMGSGDTISTAKLHVRLVNDF